MKNKSLNIIYIGSIIPLILGSITFFYWYYRRIWFAENAEIEGLSFLIILLYFLIGFVILVRCSVYIYKQKEKWKNIIIPVLIILITFPVIDLYSALYNSFEQQVFIKVINDSQGTEILRIRSDNFERAYFDNKENEFIFSYYPIRTYDWTQKISGDWYEYELNELKIELKMKNDSIRYFDFPKFPKGDCGTIRISEIIDTKE